MFRNVCFFIQLFKVKERRHVFLLYAVECSIRQLCKVCPYLVCRRTLVLLRSPNNIIFGIGHLKQLFRTFFRSKFLYCLGNFRPAVRCIEQRFLLPSTLALAQLQTVFFTQQGFSLLIALGGPLSNFPFCI